MLLTNPQRHLNSPGIVLICFSHNTIIFLKYELAKMQLYFQGIEGLPYIISNLQGAGCVCVI